MSEENKNISRREFLKGAATGIGLGALASMGIYSYSPLAGKHHAKVKRLQKDFGAIKHVKITNISETSWFDNSVLMGDMKNAGGLLVNQYEFNWPPFGNGKGIGKGSYEDGISRIRHLLPNRVDEAWQIIEKSTVHPANPGGFSCLVEITEMDDKKHKYLYDVGWSYKWMEECFKREGIDRMLSSGEIEAIILTHEHFDHFWGLPVAMKYNPNIPIYIPKGFYKEGLQYIKDSGHQGKLTVLNDEITQFFPGFVMIKFDVPIICRVFGEMSMALNVKDKGLVLVSGCNHQGIIQFVATAFEKLKYDRDQFHGIYGGLHISPFEDWDPKYDDLVISLGKYGFEKIGCNHCTGLLCAKKFIETGYPVIKGTARFRSKDTVYLGNGDTIEFG